MPSLTFRDRFVRNLEQPTAEEAPRTGEPGRDPWDIGHKLADPDQWIVNLDEPIEQLARAMSRGRGPQGALLFLLGSRWAGKSTLLHLVDQLAKSTGELVGTLDQAPELLTEDEGIQRIETCFPAWKAARTEDKLHYVLIDDAPWSSLLRGRLNQLFRLFSGHPPTVVVAMDFFDAWDLRRQSSGFFQRATKVSIHPYPKRDLLSLWVRYFEDLGLDQEAVDGIITRSLGNPGLLFEQGLEARTIKEQRGEVTTRYLEQYWKQEGYELALDLKEGSPFDEIEDDASTREEILIRVCQSEEGITATELSRDLGFDLERTLTSYHLSRLNNEGWLGRERKGASVVYFAPRPVAIAVETYLVMGYD